MLSWKSFISQPRTMSDDEDNIGPFPTEISNEVDVEDESREDTVGPLPTEMMPQSDDVSGSNDCSPAPSKKPKVLKDESVYLKNIPTAQYYEISYMHRNTITHVAYSKTHYLMTCSNDGHFKFWRKADGVGLEFIKHYRAHLDMISMLKLNFMPTGCCFIYTPKDEVTALAITDQDSSKIRIFDARSQDELLHIMEKLHEAPIVCLAVGLLNNIFILCMILSLLFMYCCLFSVLTH
ncbi:unnamed protein product [Trichobilharzia regenti]|nr:unnamed protein product [Trichobilharzia regenti]